MKILFTHEIFAPHYFGGGELEVYEVITRLNEMGHEVTFITMGSCKNDEKMYQMISEKMGKDINEIRNKMKGIKIKRISGHRYMMNLMPLQIMMYGKDCDIIHTNTFNAVCPSFIAAKILKKPIVCFVHGLYGNNWIDMRGQIFGRISRFLEKIQIKHKFNKIIFQAKFARDVGIDIGIPKNMVEIIAPGLFYSIEKYKIKNKEMVVLFVGRLSKQKGLEYLIEAAKKHPNIKFILAGDGEEGTILKKIAPKNVVFKGFVSEDEKIDLLSRALIFCLPSIGEGFGLVLIEAMASGCAIISTVDIGFEGTVIDKKNSDQISEAIREMVSNLDKTKQMGITNREKSKKYNWENFMKELILTYKKLL